MVGPRARFTHGDPGAAPLARRRVLVPRSGACRTRERPSTSRSRSDPAFQEDGLCPWTFRSRTMTGSRAASLIVPERRTPEADPSNRHSACRSSSSRAAPDDSRRSARLPDVRRAWRRKPSARSWYWLDYADWAGDDRDVILLEQRGDALSEPSLELSRARPRALRRRRRPPLRRADPPTPRSTRSRSPPAMTGSSRPRASTSRPRTPAPASAADLAASARLVSATTNGTSTASPTGPASRSPTMRDQPAGLRSGHPRRTRTRRTSIATKARGRGFEHRRRRTSRTPAARTPTAVHAIPNWRSSSSHLLDRAADGAPPCDGEGPRRRAGRADDP